MSSKKKSLKQKWDAARASLKGMKAKDLKAAFDDTVDDIRKDPQEKALFAAGALLPFGVIGYGAYRIEKYRRKKAANDNREKPPAPPQTPKP